LQETKKKKKKKMARMKMIKKMKRIVEGRRNEADVEKNRLAGWMQRRSWGDLRST
jgi:hypothetical protein